MPDWVPEWVPELEEMDLNLMNVWWTVPFLIGSIAALIHMVAAWQRWRATVSERSSRADQAASFWLFRQDVLSLLTGAAMTAGGVLAILRHPQEAVVCLLIGATAFAANKVWNLFDDARVLFFVRARRLRQAERARKD